MDPTQTIVYMTQRGGLELVAFPPARVPKERQPEVTPPEPSQPRGAAGWVIENLGRCDQLLGTFDRAVLLVHRGQAGDERLRETWCEGFDATAFRKVPESEWPAFEEVLVAIFGGRWRDSIAWSDLYVYPPT